MGALAHYLEEEGLATTQISLVREHTEVIRPPRALWVPFELGRPFGAPNDAAFQTRVLMSVLGLLEAAEGPVLSDFDEEAPGCDSPGELLACPVNFSSPDQETGTLEQLLHSFIAEASQMGTWYDLSRRSLGRTTSGVSGLEPEQLVEFLVAFARGEVRESPLAEVSVTAALRMAVEDLKACYLEAVAVQPGQFKNSFVMADWFWGQTVAARVINAIRETCLGMPDGEHQLLGKLLLVPRTQLYRFKK